MYALHANKSKQSKIKAAVAAAKDGKVNTEALSSQLGLHEKAVKVWVAHFSPEAGEKKVNK